MFPQPRRRFLERVARGYGLTQARDYGWPIWILTIGQSVSSIGRGVAIPFLAVYLVQERGIPLGVVGAAILVEQVFRALTGPAAGWVSDRVGRKPVMFTGLVSTAIAVPMFLLVTDVPSLFLVSVVVGVAEAIYFPASSGYVADVVPSERRAGAYGLVHVAVNLGWAVGIAIGAIITAATTSFVPLFVTGGLMPLTYAFILLAFLKEPARVKPRSGGNPFTDFTRLFRVRVFVAYLSLITAFILMFGLFNVVLPLFVVDGLDLPRTAISLPFVVNPALIVLLQLPLGVLGDRMDRVRVLATAAVFMAGGYAVYAWTGGVTAAGIPYLLPLVAGAVLLTVGEVLFIPVLSALASDLAPPDLRGSTMGVMGLAGAVGFGAAPVITDVVVTRWGWPWVWTVFAVWTIASAVGLLLLRGRLLAAVQGNREAAQES